MDILLGKYGLIFTEFDSIDRCGLPNSVNIRPYLLSKKSIIVYLSLLDEGNGDIN